VIDRASTQNLERILVEELRAYQALDGLTRDEQKAIAAGNIRRLSEITDEKEALLDELSRLDESRRSLLGRIAVAAGLPASRATLAALLPSFPPESSARLTRLSQGLAALAQEIRNLTHGNQALAHFALERADALQIFLLNLHQASAGYRPPNHLPPSQEPGVSLELDQAA
jgi:flagellar biosynthesis/type III secretory pathway chaperone